MKGSDALTTLRRHWPFMLVAIIGAGLIFTNLGSGYLWADEGDTAVLASNILKFGVPRAWDGVTFMDSDFGARVNNDLVMVSRDRKSTRLNSSHGYISYAVFCLKKKKRLYCESNTS